MTLTKAIEAAREALECNIVCMEGDLDGSAMIYAETKQALAALPDQPMTEDEIFKLLCDNASLDCGWHDLKTVIFILKKASVLYVEEKS